MVALRRDLPNYGNCPTPFSNAETEAQGICGLPKVLDWLFLTTILVIFPSGYSDFMLRKGHPQAWQLGEACVECPLPL